MDKGGEKLRKKKTGKEKHCEKWEKETGEKEGKKNGENAPHLLPSSLQSAAIVPQIVKYPKYVHVFCDFPRSAALLPSRSPSLQTRLQRAHNPRPVIDSML